MPPYEFTSLTFHGYGDQPVPNLFLRQTGPAKILAVEYPGLNYSCDMPKLYYPANLLLDRGADVLQVKADYTLPAFQALAVGTANQTYDASVLSRIQSVTGAEAVVIEDGDHRLQMPGDVYRSLHALEDVLRGIEGFLNRHSETTVS